MADAKASLEQYESNTGMQQSDRRTWAKCSRSSRKNSELAARSHLRSGLEATRRASHRLSEALGHIQFQDVMRQRMEHVQEALVEMREHLLRLSARKPASFRWGRAIPIAPSRSCLDAHLGQYHMASQTVDAPGRGRHRKRA
jgi:hypothetical protein